MSFGCLFIPHFPAWAFEHAVSDAKNVLVVSKRQVVAASRRARRLGAEKAMDEERVRSLVPAADFRSRDIALENAVWEEVLRELYGLTPRLESKERGVVYFGVHQLDKIRDLVAGLNARAAVAPHRATARLATLRAGPGHLLHIGSEDETAFLKRTSVHRLTELGYSEPFVHRLELFGYDAIGAASTLDLRHLRAQFGKEGKRLHEFLHPANEQPVSPFQPPSVIAESYEFDDPCSEPGRLLPALERLVKRASHRLDELCCQRIKVELCEYRAANRHPAHHVLREATQAARRLMQASERLLRKLITPSREIDTLNVELGALRQVPTSQGSLFQDRPSVHKAVRAVHRRFPNAIQRAVIHDDAIFEEDRVSFEAFSADASE